MVIELHPTALSVICALAMAGCANRMQEKPNPPLADGPVLLASYIDVRLLLGRDVLSDVAVVARPAPAAATKVVTHLASLPAQ
jgi:hypothetical protein